MPAYRPRPDVNGATYPFVFLQVTNFGNPYGFSVALGIDEQSSDYTQDQILHALIKGLMDNIPNLDPATLNVVRYTEALEVVTYTP